MRASYWAIVCAVGIMAGTAMAADEELTLNLDREAATPLLARDMVAAAPEGEPADAGPTTGPGINLDRSPLPLHTLEGYGGTTFVPLAYLMNPGKPGELCGMPSFSYSYTQAGEKDVQVYALSITFFRRVELSYAANRADLGDLNRDVVRLTGGFERVSRDDVWLHHINVRGLLVEENSCSMPVPAITAGVHFKINQGIHSIDHDLSRPFGQGLRGVGFEKASGVDFTLTGSKTFPTLLCNRPVITTAGLRWSKAAQIGWAGFGDAYRLSWEGSLIWLAREDIACGYEYRMRRTAYRRRLGLSEGEDDWHLLFVAWNIDGHVKLVGRWAYAGEMANSDESCVWGIQFQYDF